MALAQELGAQAVINGGRAVAGLNLAGHLAPSDQIGSVLNLLGACPAGTTQAVSATITAGDNALVLDVALPVTSGHALALGGAKAGLDLTCKIEALSLSTGLLEWKYPPPMLSTQFSLGTATDSIGFALVVPILATPGQRAWLSSDSKVSLAALEKALGLDSLAALLPGDIHMPALVVEAFSAEATIRPLALKRLSVTASSAEPWQLYPALKATIQPAVTFDIALGPGAPPPDISISANWQIGGTRFVTSVSPQTGYVEAHMATGQHLDIGDLIAPVLPDFVHADLELLDLEIEGNFRDKTWSLEVETSKGFALDLGGAELKVEDVEVRIEDIGYGWMTQLTGYVGIGEFMLKAGMNVSKEQLDLSVSTPSINVTDIAALFLGGLYEPDDFNDFVLDRIVAEVSRTAAAAGVKGAPAPPCSFRIEGTSSVPVDVGGGAAFQLVSFEAAREADGTKSGSVEVDIMIGARAIKLLGDYGKRGATGKHVWHLKTEGAAAEPIPLGAALGAIGARLDIPVPAAIQEIDLSDLELPYLPAAA